MNRIAQKKSRLTAAEAKAKTNCCSHGFTVDNDTCEECKLDKREKQKEAKKMSRLNAAKAKAKTNCCTQLNKEKNRIAQKKSRLNAENKLLHSRIPPIQ